MARGAAFFDLDKTLMEGSSAIHFGRAAYRAGMMSRRQLASDVWANIRFRLEGASDEATAALRQRVLDGLAGTPVKELARLGPEVLAGILPRIYPTVLRAAYEHQDAGRPAYIVTAASQELADLLARVLVLDGAIATRSEVKNGVYTGRPDGPFVYADGKAVAIREMAEREQIDLADSWAYSDSVSDLPMLETVGHAVVVNPDANLTRIARDQGWQIMRFDKLGRRLRLLAAATGLAALAGAGGYLTARQRPRSLVRRLVPSS
ncbi:MAG: HAD family hydrolase [Thermoleophilaceae bacterium]